MHEVCAHCGASDSRVYGAGEPDAICEWCMARVMVVVEDALTQRRLHDQVLHREPVQGCERCGVRR